MTPEVFSRFRKGALLRQEVVMSGDFLYVTEWRRDKELGLILRATFEAENLLTLAQQASK